MEVAKNRPLLRYSRLLFEAYHYTCSARRTKEFFDVLTYLDLYTVFPCSSVGYYIPTDYTDLH